MGRDRLAGIPLLQPGSESQGAKRDPRIIDRVRGSAERRPCRAQVDERRQLSADRGTRTASAPRRRISSTIGIAGQRRLGPTSDRGGKIVETPTQEMFVRTPRDRRQRQREADEAQVEERMAKVERTAEVARIVPVEERPPGAPRERAHAGLARPRRRGRERRRRPAAFEARALPERLAQPARTAPLRDARAVGRRERCARRWEATPAAWSRTTAARAPARPFASSQALLPVQADRRHQQRVAVVAGQDHGETARQP